MENYTVIALVLAAVFFALAAFGADAPQKLAWLPLGMLAWVSVPLVIAIRAL